MSQHAIEVISQQIWSQRYFTKRFKSKQTSLYIFYLKALFAAQFFTSCNHFCNISEPWSITLAFLYMINWICMKMIFLNSIEQPFFKFFCCLLDPNFKIPETKELRKIIIQYANSILLVKIKNLKTNYVSNTVIVIQQLQLFQIYFQMEKRIFFSKANSISFKFIKKFETYIFFTIKW